MSFYVLITMANENVQLFGSSFGQIRMLKDIIDRAYISESSLPCKYLECSGLPCSYGKYIAVN
jgi:hypothetical protein